MSKYTTELRNICKSFSDKPFNLSTDSIDDIIEQARPKIFNFNYPFFNQEHRELWECKFLKHFYMREIAHETFGMFQLRLSTRLNELMPYYNRMYESELLQFNPFDTVNTERKIESTATAEDRKTGSSVGRSGGQSQSIGSENGCGKSNSKNKDKYSDTPQESLTNVENGTYLTNYRVDENEAETTDSTNSNTSNSSLTENVVNATESRFNENDGKTTEKFSGKNSGESYSKLLMEYRQTFLNIDLMLIEELDSLFMQIW